jgi:hypothetical protein
MAVEAAVMVAAAAINVTRASVATRDLCLFYKAF